MERMWDVARTRRRRWASAAVLLVAGAWARAAAADPADVINGLRRDGCARAAPVGTAVRRDSALDAAARELANGRNLRAAVARVGYPAARSEMFHVGGPRADEAIRGILAERYCTAINHPSYTELGFHQNGNDTWIVMAVRAAQPFAALQNPIAVTQQVFDLVNAARAEARECGRTQYPAAAPLALSPVLTAAAAVHSLDMAEHGTLSHSGSDGSDSGERITRTGYVWQWSGENVAAGQDDAAAAVAAWLSSPGHCATLMNPNFTETGIAFALAPGQEPDVYWTQVFGTPR